MTYVSIMAPRNIHHAKHMMILASIGASGTTCHVCMAWDASSTGHLAKNVKEGLAQILAILRNVFLCWHGMHYTITCMAYFGRAPEPRYMHCTMPCTVRRHSLHHGIHCTMPCIAPWHQCMHSVGLPCMHVIALSSSPASVA